MVWAVAERGSTRNGYKDGCPLDSSETNTDCCTLLGVEFSGRCAEMVVYSEGKKNATIRQETIKNCHSKLLTVWCGMTATRVIGPYLLHDTMNAERYLQMLKDYVWLIVSG